MPNKTIYVSDDDLALYKRAQEIERVAQRFAAIGLDKFGPTRKVAWRRDRQRPALEILAPGKPLHGNLMC